MLPQGLYALTPLYDVICIWPLDGNELNQFSIFKAKLVMAVLGKKKHHLFKDIQRRHFSSMAAQCFMRKSAEDLIKQVLANVPTAIDAVNARLPPGFPDWITQSICVRFRRSEVMLEFMLKNRSSKSIDFPRSVR